MVEIYNEGDIRDVIALENFLINSVARVGIENIDPQTRDDLKNIAELLNKGRANFGRLHPNSGDEEIPYDVFLKNTHSYIDPETIVMRGWLESEVPVHA